jgi:hypothetical protein
MPRRAPAPAGLRTGFLPAALAQSGAAQALKFATVDTKPLEEVSELDRQFEKKDLVRQDPERTAHLNNVREKNTI